MAHLSQDRLGLALETTTFDPTNLAIGNHHPNLIVLARLSTTYTGRAVTSIAAQLRLRPNGTLLFARVSSRHIEVTSISVAPYNIPMDIQVTVGSVHDVTLTKLFKNSEGRLPNDASRFLARYALGQQHERLVVRESRHYHRSTALWIRKFNMQLKFTVVSKSRGKYPLAVQHGNGRITKVTNGRYRTDHLAVITDLRQAQTRTRQRTRNGYLIMNLILYPQAQAAKTVARAHLQVISIRPHLIQQQRREEGLHLVGNADIPLYRARHGNLARDQQRRASQIIAVVRRRPTSIFAVTMFLHFQMQRVRILPQNVRTVAPRTYLPIIMVLP